MGTREEIELIVKLSIAQMDLKYKDELSAVNTKLAAIPGNIAEAIKGCQAFQEAKRRWSVSTLLSVLAVSVSIGVAVKTLF